MTEPSYKPCRERNSISQFVASIQMFHQVPQRNFADIQHALDRAKESLELPATVQQQPLLFPSGMSPAMGGDMPQTFVGYERFAPNGEIAEKLVCDSDEIVYSTADYSSWESISKRFFPVIFDLIAQYHKHVPAIRSIKLQYINDYIPISNESKPIDLIRNDSRWVSNVHDFNSPWWHSHSGTFLPMNDLPWGRFLVNVNCDSVELDKIGPRLKVLIVASCNFDIVGQPPLVLDSVESIPDQVAHFFNAAHDLEKSVLEEVVDQRYLLLNV